jgi:hypothetical protein
VYSLAATDLGGDSAFLSVFNRPMNMLIANARAIKWAF